MEFPASLEDQTYHLGIHAYTYANRQFKYNSVFQKLTVENPKLHNVSFSAVNENSSILTEL